ncbi:tRNA1(Val) (adenine(37)-N6)-methyltransferase [Acidiphilium sp.]|uniref:tRNA1(Val) (adenine(37)-N6)-methyltransferase n=1 Tax=Acidiphilium sp. TaxID=527 RepID=UPI003CFF6514
MTATIGTLLGGKLTYRQLTTGHRSGIEPVLLAATVPARPGDTVIEAGTGAGAGLLCLGHRVPGLRGLGIERDPALAALAAANFRANAQHGLAAIAADIGHLPLQLPCDHGFANPPWRDLTDTASPDGARGRAHRAPPGLLLGWTKAIAALLKSGGTLTLILPAGALDDCLTALHHARCGGVKIMPLWPRSGRAAKLIIVQARKAARGRTSLLPGLILHDESGFTPQAESLLRAGNGLRLA